MTKCVAHVFPLRKARNPDRDAKLCRHRFCICANSPNVTYCNFVDLIKNGDKIDIFRVRIASKVRAMAQNEWISAQVETQC